MDVVTFDIGGRSLAVELSAVQEVLRVGPVTPAAWAPDAVVGAMNVGGHIVPVVDVGALLGDPPATVRPGASGLLLEVGDQQIVLHVQRVEEVQRVSSACSVAEASASELLRPLSTDRGAVQLLHLPTVVQLLHEAVRATVEQFHAPTAPGAGGRGTRR